MWLLLADDGDSSADPLAAALRPHVADVLCIRAADLARVRSWEHYVPATTERGEAWFRLQLADGRVIDSRACTGVLNRLRQPPLAAVAGVRTADRLYALQEIHALLLSCLESLTCPIFNPPHGQGLSGAWRSPTEWCQLAARAGFRLAPRTFSSTATPGAAWHGAPLPPTGLRPLRVLVVGSVVLPRGDTPAPPDPISIAARSLARAAAQPLLELLLQPPSGAGSDRSMGEAWAFLAAEPFPHFAADDPVLPDFTTALLAAAHLTPSSAPPDRTTANTRTPFPTSDFALRTWDFPS